MVPESVDIRILTIDSSDPFKPIMVSYPETTFKMTKIGRVNGDLAVSRAIGDIDLKKPRVDNKTWYPPPDHAAFAAYKSPTFEFKDDLVSAEPEWISMDLTDKDEFVIIACDGLWDVSGSCCCCCYLDTMNM